jgi:hypothetical protein
MDFESPIWLVLLGPWIALTVWLLRGRADFRAVPFLNLWENTQLQRPRPFRAWRLPPLSFLALLMALLAAIFAAAGPRWRWHESAAAPNDAVRLVYLAAREVPTTQAMVRVRNESDATSAELAVISGGGEVSNRIKLPSRGAEASYFVDLAAAGDRISAEIFPPAGVSGDTLEAPRQHSWPVVEGDGLLPAAVRRVIAVYTSLRPAGAESKHIAVTTEGEDATAAEATAFVLPHGQGVPLPAGSRIDVEDHILTRGIGWKAAVADSRVSSPRGPGWNALVKAGGKVVVAVREGPVRQIWVGFDPEKFSHRPDFVVMWSTVFQWLGDGGDGFAAARSEAGAHQPAGGAVGFALLAGKVLIFTMILAILSAATWQRPMMRQANVGKC